MEELQRVELRSEKVRSIITKIPPILTRIGVTVITCIIVIIMILMYLIPYYQTKNIQINIENIDGVFFAKGAVAIKDAQQFQIGQKVDMILYYIDGDHILNGSIYTMTEFEGKAIVLIQLVSQDDANKLSLLPSGEASIIISSAPLLKRIMNLY